MNGRKITTFLLGLSLLSTVGGSLFISSFQNKVTITPNILYGDAASVEGLSLNLPSYLESFPSGYSLTMLNFLDPDVYEHSWNIEIPLSDPENSLTTYAFQGEISDFYWGNLFYVSPYISISRRFQWQVSDDELDTILLEEEEISSLEKELHNLVERAKNENTTFLSETYLLSDFLEEYPIYTSVSVHQNGKQSVALTQESDKKLQDLFQSAVHPEHLIALDVGIEDSVYVTGSIGNHFSNQYSIESYSAGFETEGYFTHQLVNTIYSEEHNVLSRSSDDVAKLYHISFSPVDNSNFSLLEIETLVEIGSLPENQRIASMCLTNEGNFALLTEDMNTKLLSLDFYDLTTFTLLDSFPLASSESCFFYQVYQYSEGISVTIYLDGVRTVWVFKENQGDYQPFLEGIPVSVIDYLENPDYIRSYITEMDFINDKLVVVHLIQHGDYLDYYPLVAVFDKTGLLFLGEFHSSQNLTVEHYIHKSSMIKLFSDPSFFSTN